MGCGGGGRGPFDGWQLKISRFDGWRLTCRSFDGWRLIFRNDVYHTNLKHKIGCKFKKILKYCLKKLKKIKKIV